MPTSYQAPSRGDKADRSTYSQTTDTNMSSETALVRKLMDSKEQAVFSIQPEQTLGDAVAILRDRRIGALLVTDDAGALQGILSERDIVRKLADAPGQTLPHQVKEVMTSKVEVCGPEDTLVSVLRRMTEGKFRHMPVVDGGKLTGVITIGDVVHFRLTELEHEALQLKQMIVG